MTTVVPRNTAQPIATCTASHAEAAAAAAAQTLDPDIFAWIQAGAGQGRCAERNRAAFGDATVTPRILASAGSISASVVILGQQWPLPIGIAPMAYHRLAHADGELATVTGAARTGTPLCVSMFATATFADIAAQAPATPLWLQLYTLRDWGLLLELTRRAREAGFSAIMLTADSPVLGQWAAPFPAQPGIRPVNLPDRPGYTSPAGHSQITDQNWTWRDLRELCHASDLPVIVKGVLDPRDARNAADFGARGLVVSNHGGRQLEQAPATLSVLPDIAAAIGKELPVLVDGGVRTGADVLLALEAGADAVLVGRPVLYALAAGGADGVNAYLEHLGQDLHRAMTLAGRPSSPRRSVLPRRLTARPFPLSPAGTGTGPGTAHTPP